MSYRLAKQDQAKGIYLTIEKKFWDKDKEDVKKQASKVLRLPA